MTTPYFSGGCFFRQLILILFNFDIQSEILELRRNHHIEIGKILTLEQTVKYVVFDHAFKKRL